MDGLLLSTVSECPLLDTHDREGLTGYIDFIHINEITDPVMVGTDCYNRPFITLTVDLYYSDNTSISTFTTLFKRYTDTSSHLWQSCNSGLYIGLFNTCGGMNKTQFLFLYSLLQDKEYYFNNISKLEKEEKEEYDNLKLSYPLNNKKIVKAVVVLHNDINKYYKSTNSDNGSL